MAARVKRCVVPCNKVELATGFWSCVIECKLLYVGCGILLILLMFH